MILIPEEYYPTVLTDPAGIEYDRDYDPAGIRC